MMEKSGNGLRETVSRFGAGDIFWS